jgi:Uncharacterized protein conserved in bacteria
MPTHIALLRAVNVGGVQIKMDDLKRLCAEAGFGNVRTYIASGNVILDSDLDEAGVKAELEARLKAAYGRVIGVVIRSPGEMRALAAANPWPDRSPTFTVAIFLDAAPPADALDHATNVGANEEMRLGPREILVFYGDGQGRSKLRIPAAAEGTARNFNTVVKLAEMASEG